MLSCVRFYVRLDGKISVTNMANKVSRNTKSKCLVATLVTENRAPCVFCQRIADDELIYGKLYAIGDIQCHYFCVLLSCCLIQKGKDEQGLFGFLYADILAEVERSKKHRCSYCSKGGATLGCSISQCRKQFHLPCGRERNAVSLFYDNYKSFCQLHAPKQKIPNHIIANVRVRIKHAKSKNIIQNSKAPQKLSCLKELIESPANDDTTPGTSSVEMVCLICYEAVDGFPTSRTFWPPCCARDAWFHRTCLQRMALSAGMHYLKCPLCNDKENFYDAVVSQGYYVPDRDAAWELEQNAFADIYERPLLCGADVCRCPEGKNHDAETGEWDIKLCILCGTSGMHAGCLPQEGRFVCATCKPAAPGDLETLAVQIEALILAEQASNTRNERRGPVMPSRMSLRRTKQRIDHNAPSTSVPRNDPAKTDSNNQGQKTDTESSRLELNLKTPKRSSKSQKSVETLGSSVLKDIENKLLSPLKQVEQGLQDKLKCLGVKEIDIDSNKVLEKVRNKFKEPRPLSVKKKIVNNILESLFDSIVKKNHTTKEAVKDWNSPKKGVDTSPNMKKSTSESMSQTNNATHQINSKPAKQISTKAGEKENQKNVIEEKSEAIDKFLINDDTTPSKQGNTKEIRRNTVTPTKKENRTEMSIQKDSITKSIDEENYKLVGATPQKEDISEKISDEKYCISNETVADDDSSNSTFVLPSEFVAERNSDDSLPLFETPKKLKTVDIQKDSSLEICENDEVVNINHIIIEHNTEKSEFLRNLNLISPVKTKKCAFKFSTKDKEILQEENMDIDLESFKNHYLNEVDKEFKCNFGHKHNVKEEKDDQTPTKLRTAIDYALEACKRENGENCVKNLKRKLSIAEEVVKKKKRKEKHKGQSPKIKLVYNSRKKEKRNARRKKIKNSAVQIQNQKENTYANVEVVCPSNSSAEEENITQTIDLTIEAAKERKNKITKKIKNKKMLRGNFKVKIKFKEEQLRLKITKSQGEKRTQKHKKKILNQYVLKYYSPDDKTRNSPRKVIEKPEHPVTPIKKNHKLKLEKSPDNMIQTSIQSFFKVKPCQ